MELPQLTHKKNNNEKMMIKRERQKQPAGLGVLGGSMIQSDAELGVFLIKK